MSSKFDIDLRYSTVAVALWAMEAAPITPTLALTVDAVLQGGVGPIISNNPPWSPRGREV
jgi:hypothetical protein